MHYPLTKLARMGICCINIQANSVVLCRLYPGWANMDCRHLSCLRTLTLQGQLALLVNLNISKKYTFICSILYVNVADNIRYQDDSICCGSTL